MSRQHKGRGELAFRIITGVAAICLGFFIGCGNLGGGCEATGNENANANDNSPDNINDNGTVGNDNVDDNDNLNENENDNGTGTGNDNGSTGGNDNGTGGNSNDNGTGGNTNSNANGNTNGNTNTNANTNTNSNANSNTNANTNTNANSNTNTNTNTNGNPGGNTNTNSGPQAVAARSSGAAQPGMTVTLFLDQDLPASCEPQAIWTQTSGTNVALTQHGVGTSTFPPGSASFLAPAVAASPSACPGSVHPACLAFSVSIPANCAAGEPARTGTVSVPIQVADLVFSLPASIEEGDSLDLDVFTAVTNAPNDFLALYFSEDPLPAGVDLDINQFTSVLTVNDGAGQTVRITVQVFGAAGLLAEASDTIMIVVPTQ